MNAINEKAVLLSFNPKKCEHIVTGKETVDVRKNKPKLTPPFKCYICCTKSGEAIYGNGSIYVTDHFKSLNEKAATAFMSTSGLNLWNGKVIGEFVCDEIIYIYEEKEVHTELDGWPVEAWLMWDMSDRLLEKMQLYDIKSLESCTCMKESDLIYYLSPDMQGYGWHISNLVIYDKPKSLSDFRLYDCRVEIENGYPMPTHEINRPPQSWYYVEETE